MARLLSEESDLRDAENRRAIDKKGSKLYPLHLAVKSGNPELVKVVLEAGFNAQRRSDGSHAQSALGVAVESGRLDLVEVRVRTLFFVFHACGSS